jgi:hypothetical protein
MITTWNVQKNLHSEIKDYKESVNNLPETEEKDMFDLTFHINYLEFLAEATSSISNLKEKLKNNPKL